MKMKRFHECVFWTWPIFLHIFIIYGPILTNLGSKCLQEPALKENETTYPNLSFTTCVRTCENNPLMGVVTRVRTHFNFHQSSCIYQHLSSSFLDDHFEPKFVKIG